MNCDQLTEKLQAYFPACFVYWDPAPDRFFTTKGATLKVKHPSVIEPFTCEFQGESWMEHPDGDYDQVVFHAEQWFSRAPP